MHYTQGSLDWMSTYHLAGDLHDLAPPRTAANLCALQERGVSLPVDILRWDACRLPLKTSSIDAVVTDLVSYRLYISLWMMYYSDIVELVYCISRSPTL